MWSDLFKRWVDMMTWWLPQRSDSSGSEEQPTSHQQSAHTSASSPGPSAHGTPGSETQSSGDGAPSAPTTSAEASTTPQAGGHDEASPSVKPSARETPSPEDQGRGDGPSSAATTSGEASATPRASVPDEANQSDTSQQDDLTEIKGIGPSTRDRLHAAGIMSFADLASADPSKLTQQIKEEMVVSESRVQEWIANARSRTR